MKLTSFVFLLIFAIGLCFVLYNCQAYKEIGNAVPIPLALALGRALGSALIANTDRNVFDDEDDRSTRAVSVDV